MNYLLLWTDMILFWGSNSRRIMEHKHPVIQLIISENETFLMQDSFGKRTSRGFLIAFNHPHSGDAKDIQILSLGINPKSSLGEWINSNYLFTDNIIEFPSKKLHKLDFSFFKELLKNARYNEIRNFVEEIFDYPSDNYPQELDERIQDTINYISKHIATKINNHALTDIAHLSESRLIHLFKNQVGVPIRNYIHWRRLQLALQFVFDGNSLTQSAYRCGFSDQAHLTRTCVNLIGIPPSALARNSNFVQVFNPL